MLRRWLSSRIGLRLLEVGEYLEMDLRHVGNVDVNSFAYVMNQ